jgi:hypothetical protein
MFVPTPQTQRESSAEGVGRDAFGRDATTLPDTLDRVGRWQCDEV